MINALKKIIYYMIGPAESIEELKKRNSIYMITAGGAECVDKIEGLQISFEGEGNIVIVFGGSNIFSNCKIELRKDDLVVINKSQYMIRNLKICSLREKTFTWIGEDFSCSQAIFNLKDKKSIFVGNDCMFSNGINILNSDMHAILDENGKLLNPGEDIYIGNHVWIGQNVEVLKGVQIPNNSVVGANSVVTSKWLEDNIIIAGNPAKIIKKNINWSRRPPEQFEVRK